MSTSDHDTRPVNLLYILADNNLVRLINNKRHHDSELHMYGGKYGYPLFAALVKGYLEATMAVLQIGNEYDENKIFEELRYAPDSLRFRDGIISKKRRYHGLLRMGIKRLYAWCLIRAPISKKKITLLTAGHRYYGLQNTGIRRLYNYFLIKVLISNAEMIILEGHRYHGLPRMGTKRLYTCCLIRAPMSKRKITLLTAGHRCYGLQNTGTRRLYNYFSIKVLISNAEMIILEGHRYHGLPRKGTKRLCAYCSVRAPISKKKITVVTA
ncbi:hypothetical protein F4777DRAFT_145854 [Nemania sp. FL0916]|nr:hypothetical protein F4777DRAFT_145854 [Nemania sp. FL0916]